jgi:phosphohistidine phosphatase
MNIYLVRHAKALPVDGERITADEDRPLSELGLHQVALLARGFQRLGVPLDTVLTSPLVRARQTAEELVRRLGRTDLEVRECDPLAPGGLAKKLMKFIRTLGSEHAVLVGHQPDLGEHAAYLIGSKKARVAFAKGGAACIACDRPPRKGAGTLLWLITPEWLNTETPAAAPPSG